MTPDEFSELVHGALGDLDGWWPGDDAFEIAVSAILVQGVAWRNVLQAMGRLRERGLLTPGALRRADRPQLEQCLVPAIYYHQKAGYLQEFAGWVDDELGADLLRLAGLGRAEVLRRLRARRGIGEETASAIAVYALSMPLAVVDAYALRILSRAGVTAGLRDHGAARAALESSIDGSSDRARYIHAAIVELGQRFCRPVPLCASCPIGVKCPRLLGDTSPGRWGVAGRGRRKATPEEGGDGRGAAHAPVERRGGTRTRALG